MRVSRVPFVLMVMVAAVMSPAVLAHSANNAFRLGAAWVDPDGQTTVGGNQVDADPTTAYFVNYERRLIPWLGIDVDALYAKPDITVTPIGGGPAATQGETTFTGNAGINFHVLARSRVDLYLGVYAAYMDFDQTFNNATGYGALAGMDIGLTKSGLAMTASIRYTKIEAEFTQLPGTTTPYDPLSAQIGLGWRF